MENILDFFPKIFVKNNRRVVLILSLKKCFKKPVFNFSLDYCLVLLPEKFYFCQGEKFYNIDQEKAIFL